MLEPQESPTMDISRKRKPAWVREIIQEAEKYGDPEGSTRIRFQIHSPTMQLSCVILYIKNQQLQGICMKERMGRSNEKIIQVNNEE